MSKVGCIVVYSKQIEDNRTIPCGTVFYADGTDKEVSLKEAANEALNMSLDYGYSNPIENERYFNTTYEEFLSNREKYVAIATTEELKDASVEKVKDASNEDVKDNNKISEMINIVEPPEVVKGEVSENVEKVTPDDDIDFDEIEKAIQDAISKESEEKGETVNQETLNGLIEEQNAKSR